VSQLPRVLLVNPRITSRHRARFPLSLLTIAAALEGRYECTIVDGNVESDGVAAALRALSSGSFAAAGVTVMGGPQVQTAIDVSKAIRACAPTAPIVWGGYFPTLYPAAAINAPYVDFLIRGQGEQTFPALLEALGGSDSDDLSPIAGLTWRRGSEVVQNADRKLPARQPGGLLPYHKLLDPRMYLPRTFMGRRTAAYQAALGCRFRCTFCGVAAMFGGKTVLPAAQSLERDLVYLRDHIGADSIQFYDHNFFDREEDMLPLLEVMAKHGLPWWCYARADALLNLSSSTWKLVRKSGLKMAYIGAESPNDQLLKAIRKGTSSDQVMAVAEVCRSNGVVPELSFMVAPPEDPEGETERTFDFIRQIKRINPDSEIIVYIHTPLPPESVPVSSRSRVKALRDHDGNPVIFPKSPEEWTQRRWVDYSCHADAPWMTDRLRRRIKDFVTVLTCRFPTLQDTRTRPWAKSALRTVVAWRYQTARYDRPWELDVSRKLIKLMDPRVTSI
jgi:anaerobic magnesium-protoporphyrin IX monomethyl ester cyclase